MSLAPPARLIREIQTLELPHRSWTVRYPTSLSAMVQEGGLPFPLEDLYIPLVGLAIFFISIVVFGQIVTMLPLWKRSKQD